LFINFRVGGSELVCDAGLRSGSFLSVDMPGALAPSFVRRDRGRICCQCSRALAASFLIPQRRWIGLKYIAKLDDAEKQWAQQAEEIKAGTRRNVWDVLEERGFVKDIAG
jgi:tyrosyl-tRNA synthetase